MTTLFKRMLGASRLNAETYEQIEADPKSNFGAVFVVVAASVAAAIGSGAHNLVSLAAFTVAMLSTWFIWIALTYFIGVRLLPEVQTHADWGEMMRTTGFSAAPGLLRVFGIIPGIGLPIFLGVTVWMLFAFVVAVRQALDFHSLARAVGVCLLGWIIHGLLFFGLVQIAI